MRAPSSICLALALLISASTAFVVTPAQRQSFALSMSTSSTNNNLDRRALLRTLGVFGTAIVCSPVKPSAAGLLDDYGADPKTMKEKAAANSPVTTEKKSESSIEPNLRSNYYYPTNKKRYLPRIKKCNDAIPDAAAMIGSGDWEGAEEFALKIADDTILPLKLYTSSLNGGGTNVKVSFLGDMTIASKDFEKAQKKLVKAVAKRDTSASSTALEDLSVALLNYRTAGKLLGPDGGGDIPSVDDIRRSACRVQGRRFSKAVQDRDARIQGSN